MAGHIADFNIVEVKTMGTKKIPQELVDAMSHIEQFSDLVFSGWSCARDEEQALMESYTIMMQQFHKFTIKIIESYETDS